MPSLAEDVRVFLACRRIAVAGVSRDSRQPANLIYRKLRAAGHDVFAINPRAERLEGDPAYPDLRSVPGGVEVVVIATSPEVTPRIAEQCPQAGVRIVWMHRAIGPGSVAPEAVRFCRERGITVIDGACPMMFCEPVDVAHRCMRVVLGWFGRLPRCG